MLGEAFYWILNMSITAGICGLVILPLRGIKKIPRRVIVLLWTIPFLRMCIPVGIGGQYGLMTLLSRFTTKTVTIWVGGTGNHPLYVSMTNHVTAAEKYFPVTYKVDLLKDVFDVASWIWILFTIAFLAFFAVSYWLTMREMKNTEHWKDNLYLSNRVRSPAVYGILHPRIVIPYDMKDKDLHYILMHENSHIKRGDNLWRVLAVILVCVHWFHPFCWLFLKLFLSDLEIACDENVLSRCTEKQRKEYAKSLVSSAERINPIASSFGGSKIRTRLEYIFSYRRMSVVSAVGFVALVAVVAYVLLTNAG